MKNTLTVNIHFTSNLYCGQTTQLKPMKFLHKKKAQCIYFQNSYFFKSRTTLFSYISFDVKHPVQWLRGNFLVTQSGEYP